MNDAHSEFLDPELLTDAEATAQRQALSEAEPSAGRGPLDALPLSRIAARWRGPARRRLRSLRRLRPRSSSERRFRRSRHRQSRGPVQITRAHARSPCGALPPVAPPPAPSASEVTAHYRHEPLDERPRGLRSVVAGMLAPLRDRSTDGRAIMRRRLTLACLGSAAFFLILALVFGLRGAPADPGLSPEVAAATVLSRAILAVGAGALSFGLLRLARRISGEQQ